MRPFSISSESVTEGHPDKVCDQISDAILDACLDQDPAARVAVETMVTGNTVFIAGEITTRAAIDAAAIARRVIREIGYDDPALGFDADGCFVLTQLHTQSPDIALGVSKAGVMGEGGLGAGDQGIFYGYACDETACAMPAAIHLAHRLSRRLARVRKDGTLPWLRPDGKTQVTLRHDGAGRPLAAEGIIVSAQHHPEVAREDLVRGIIEQVICPEMGDWLRPQTRVLINPTGRFVEGGPAADTGLTGRKLMVDTYGGCARHGGGAFSGKDATKVDRSAAYMARHIAKTVVAAGLAARCQVALAYAIGGIAPEMVSVETFDTEQVDPVRIEQAIENVFPLSVSGMIDLLDLRRPQFRRTAAYGHFGRDDQGFAWERTDRVGDLRAACGP